MTWYLYARRGLFQTFPLYETPQVGDYYGKYEGKGRVSLHLVKADGVAECGVFGSVVQAMAWANAHPYVKVA